LVELADGTRFSVGTGFSDAQRGRPPAVGGLITFRYQELSEGGVPRFPSFLGVRHDVAAPSELKTSVGPPATGAPTTPGSSATRRAAPNVLRYVSPARTPPVEHTGARNILNTKVRVDAHPPLSKSFLWSFRKQAGGRDVVVPTPALLPRLWLLRASFLYSGPRK